MLQNHRRKIINEVKKKKYSGKSVIMMYEVSNALKIFSGWVIKTNLILYTRKQMDQTIKQILYIVHFKYQSSFFDADQ